MLRYLILIKTPRTTTYPPSMSVAESRDQLDGLHEYAGAMPHLFCQEHVLALGRTRDTLAAHQQRTCKQISMTSFFGAK
jgi:hypothetical protein